MCAHVDKEGLDDSDNIVPIFGNLRTVFGIGKYEQADNNIGFFRFRLFSEFFTPKTTQHVEIFSEKSNFPTQFSDFPTHFPIQIHS